MMKFWINAFRCWIDRPSWYIDPLYNGEFDDDPDWVQNYCANCNGFVKRGRHSKDMFPER